LLSLLLGIWFFFWSYLNGIVSLYSFSICSFLVYRKATGFVSWFCTVTLLKLFMLSSSFGVEIFGSLKNRIISYANKDGLTLFFNLFVFPLLLLDLLLWLGIPGLHWKWVGRVGLLVLFPTLGEMVSGFSH
jgi:hypothetical protein